MIDLRAYLSPRRVVDLASRGKDGAIMELVAVAAESPAVEDAEKLQDAVFEREGIMSTGIGLGIAIPHAKIPSIRDFVVVIGRAPGGLDFNALDQKPVTIVVLIAGPSQEQQRYLEILAAVTLRLKSEEVRRAVLAAPTPAAVVDVLARS
ncbi:MAG: PTS sugar transporter subunit IIA [Planctomycetes bacterium]|jgi:PTS system nitrogen regulatory IIA component|nr:PTS sugar transporter subunit IIA [Planctomycetota bacterium]